MPGSSSGCASSRRCPIQTPEGKSIVELGAEQGIKTDPLQLVGVHMVKFTAETKCSGVDMPDGTPHPQGRFGSDPCVSCRGGATDSAGRYRSTVRRISENGGTPLVVCENERIMGVIELQDIIKTGIRERFERLRKMGVKTVMVTGDNPLTAKYIAEQAGVDDFIAEARPEDKLEYIRREQRAGKLVAMMGDGTNDAPALAQADVGVAMNSGTQAAKEAGNMVDLDNDPTKLIEIVEIGKQLLMTRGTLTTFSIANDVAKYFAIVPALFIASIPSLQALNIMHLAFARKRHPVGGDLQRGHHPAADSAGPARRDVQTDRSLGPAAPQPLHLRARRRHRAVRGHQTDRHVGKCILLTCCLNYEKPLDFSEDNAGDVRLLLGVGYVLVLRGVSAACGPQRRAGRHTYATTAGSSAPRT